MTRNVEFYVNRANEKFEAGFTTMTSKNEALQDLGHAYDFLKEEIRNLCLTFPRENRTEQQDDVYWGIPHDLYQWKPKHTALVLSVFPHAEVFTSQIETLVEARNAIKSAEVVKVERSVNPRAEMINKSVAEIIALRKSQFERGVQLYDIFNGLPVTATWHYVTNQFGTSFIRVFYYMAGKLTPLNMIIAVLEAKTK